MQPQPNPNAPPAINDPRMRRMLKQVGWQTGHTIDAIDVRRQALPPGKRISKTGKVYYENRKNRSDQNGTM